MIEGWASQIRNGDVQAAIERACQRYQGRFGKPPTHVELPPGVDLTKLNLWTLQVSPRVAAPGMVVVGRMQS